MARALGRSAQTLMLWEGTYGTAPSGNWLKMPMVSGDFGVEQGLIDDDALTGVREMLDPSQDVIKVNHSHSVPVDLNNFGHWLRALLGEATDTGSTHYTHTWKSGGATLPSFSKEIGLTDVNEFFVATGCMLGSMKFTQARSGLVACDLSIVGQGGSKSTSSAGGTPTQLAYMRFSQFQAAATVAGSPIAGITASNFTLDNQLQPAATIRNDGKIEGIDPGMFKASGQVTCLFEDTTFIDDAAAHTSVALAFSWTISANASLTITLPRVFLPQPKNRVSGPGGISATYDFTAAFDSVTGASATAVLKNDTATYTPA